MDKRLNKYPTDLVGCWHDDERMNFLFSDFPADSSLNADHWLTKLNFWTNLISDLCSNCSCVSIDYETVSVWLERNGRKPLGLSIVWENMKHEKKLVPALEHIGDIARNSSWFGWGMNMLVRKPTMWAAGKMLTSLKNLSPVKTSNIRREQFICVKAFESKCKLLLDRMHASSQRSLGNLHVISFVDLQNIAGHIAADENDLELLLLALESEKKIVIFSRQNSSVSASAVGDKFIKFVKPTHSAVTPVTECDVGVIKLDFARVHLEKQISLLYAEQNRLVETAKDCVRKGERSLAKNALRQKQRTITSIKNKEVCLDNIQQLLHKVQQCETDHMIMEAYKSGVAAYRENMKMRGLSVEAVEETLDSVNEMLDEHEEISKTLAEPVGDDVTSDELEKELRDLLDDAADNNQVLSNQTDADIAKLISGMSLITAGSPTKRNSSAKSSMSSRKKGSTLTA